jgi:hypothetical protein
MAAHGAFLLQRSESSFCRDSASAFAAASVQIYENKE